MEGISDLADRETFAEFEEDLHFAIGEEMNGIGVGVGEVSGKDGDQSAGHGGADGDFAETDFIDGLKEFVTGLLFHDIPSGAGFQDPVDVKGFLMHAQDQDACVRSGNPHIFNEFQSTSVRKTEIHNCQVRFEFDGHFHTEGCGGGFPDDFEIGSGFDQCPEALTHDRMVIHQEDQVCFFGIGHV